MDYIKIKLIFNFLFWNLVFSIFLAQFAFAEVTVTVSPATQNINPGLKATVKITSTGANKCTVSGGSYNKNNVQLNGNILLSPTVTTRYTFVCNDTSQSTATATASVVVLGNTNTTQNNTGNTGSLGNNPVNQNTNQQTSQTPQISYGNQTTETEANSICSAYSGFKSVYDAASAGGGSSVPVDLTQLKPVLEAINKNTQLTANEMRAADMIRFCRILPNVAAASAKLAQESAKNLKTIADNCYANEKCLVERVYKSQVEKEIKELDSFPIFASDIKKMYLELFVNKENVQPIKNISDIEKCSQLRAQGRNPTFCSIVPTKEEIIKKEVLAARDRLDGTISEIQGDFYKNSGVIGSRTCVKTKSGNDPTNVSFYDQDCIEWNNQPSIINQEILKQITALPYTQAFSTAAELGVDQNINNINTRSRIGDLINPDVGANFGGGTGSTGGTGGTGGTGSVANLKEVEASYKKILSNIGVITNLYDVAKAAYASSTSVCKNIPVESRALTVKKVEDAKKTYTDYASSLTKAWDNAIKTPNENHINLITKINFDLKDKYSQDLINKVYESVKSLLKVCVDATAKTS